MGKELWVNMKTSFFCILREGFKQIGRNKGMSLASVFSITAMLLILGVFFAFIVNINVAMEAAKQDYDTVQIYLLDETELSVSSEMVNILNAMPEVLEAKYIPKEDALNNWKAQWGDSGYLLESLADNPLPNAIEIDVLNLEGADIVVAEAKTFTGVEDILYYKETVEKLIVITSSVQIATLIMMLFLVLVSIVVVSNTIKLTVQARGREIEIMKYVGATNWFIRGPFLLEGMFIGLISSGLACGIVALLYHKVVELIGAELLVIIGIPMVPVQFLSLNLAVIFVALGVSIGASGSIISMRRYLDT
jgi:cell division transport system permease protein